MQRILLIYLEVGERAETEKRSELLYARRRRLPSASADEIESSASEPGAGTIEYSMTSVGANVLSNDSLESNLRVVPAADSSPRSIQPNELCGFATHARKSAVICADVQE